MDQQGSKTIYSSFTSTSTYEAGNVLGNGSFGIVVEATEKSTGRKLAIKRVLQDPRYKNRELDMLKELKHDNVVSLVDYFYSNKTLENQGEGRGDSPRRAQILERGHGVLASYHAQRFKGVHAAPKAHAAGPGKTIVVL